MTRQSMTSSKSVSSKSTISTSAASTTSYSSLGSHGGGGGPSHHHKRNTGFGGHHQQHNHQQQHHPSPKSMNVKSIEHRDDNMMARVADRSGAFPQMMPPSSSAGGASPQQTYSKNSQAMSSGHSIGSNSGPIPQSPRRMTYNHPPQIPPSPSSSHQSYHQQHANMNKHHQTVNLTPKLHQHLHRGAVPSSGASVGSNGGGIPLPRSNSREISSGNTVASNGSGSGGGSGRGTPTRQHRRHMTDDDNKRVVEYDDSATYMSHNTHNSSSGNSRNDYSQGGGGGGSSSAGQRFILPSPNHGSSSQSVVTGSGASVASNSSGPRFAASVAGSIASKHHQHPGIDVSLQDSVKQKGIAKRKRKEYAKDPRYTPVRRVVDELNKAIGPEKRRVAIERACIEFDHGNELQHNAELYLGAANVLCLVLSMSDQEDEIRSICSALEMVYRAEREAVIISYQDVGAALVPLLLRLLERCEKGRKVISAEATISNISRILLHMTRISELRVPLVGHPGMLAALERVATLPLSMENRVLRMRLLANLANSEGNKVTIFERSSLMEATMKVATLDKAESAREYASAVLMDLSSCPANQVAMAKMDKVLATLVKLAVVEDKTETREYAVSGLQNLAFEKKNRVQLVSYGSGVVIEALKKCTSSDTNDKTRRRAAGAITNLACDETAEKMANHRGLFQTLAQASVSDENKDVQQRATLALTKLANSINVKMSCWDTLLDALITASQCTMSDGIVSAMFRVKTRAEENRTSMAGHPRLLETLAQLCLRTKGNIDENEKGGYKDCENATKAIAHLANDPVNHKLICNKHILAALVHGASLAGQAGVTTRDAAILAMERMAMEHSNRPMMARYPGMLVSIAQATEREMNEELNGIPASSASGQPRLAKPLLMSLLVAM